LHSQLDNANDLFRDSADGRSIDSDDAGLAESFAGNLQNHAPILGLFGGRSACSVFRGHDLISTGLARIGNVVQKSGG
jgi:hypothetical protein